MNLKVRNTVLSAMFLAIGLVLPFFTGQIPQVGKMLLPMHIPVILCGLICGWKYGLVVGLVTPLFRSMLFGMPMIFPTAVAMAFELAAYGGIAGAVYGKSKWQCIRALYRALFIAMVLGRIVWGMVMMVLMGAASTTFTWQLFISGAVLNAVPGIILQLILIPAVMVLLDRTKLIPFMRRTDEMRAKNG